MELVEFERVYETFRAFHAEFAADFGRKQWREHSEAYLQGLLVQSEERRNAEYNTRQPDQERPGHRQLGQADLHQ